MSDPFDMLKSVYVHDLAQGQWYVYKVAQLNMRFSWRFVKLREEGSEQIPLVDIQDYLIEMTIPEESILVGKRVHELTGEIGTDNVLMGVVSDKGAVRKPHHRETFEALQILVLKISPDDVAGIQTEFGLIIDPDLEDPKQIGELGEFEAMITPRSRLIGRKYNYFKRMARGILSLLGFKLLISSLVMIIDSESVS